MIDACRTALRLDPNLPDALHVWLMIGRNLDQLGRYDEAAQALREGQKAAATRTGDGTSALERPANWDHWIADAERRAALLGRLDAALAGRDSPKDAMEAFTFAELARWRRECHAASTRFMIEALQLDPTLMDDVNLPRGFEAAIAAVLAASGRTRDAAGITPEEPARWRQLAVAWLRAELERMKARFPAESIVAALEGERIKTVSAESWKDAPGLAAIRDEPEIAKLPVAEQEACRALWRDVDEVLAKAKEAAQ